MLECQAREAPRVAAARRHAKAQLGEPQDAGKAALGDVDGLHAVQRIAAGIATEKAAFDVQHTIDQAPASHQPRDDAGDDRDADGNEFPAGIAMGMSTAHEACKNDEADGNQMPSGTHDGRKGVQALPRRGCVGVGIDHRGTPPTHRPAARASPSRLNASRRRCASSRLSPGITASLAAAAVCMCSVLMPNMRSSGPATTSTNCMRP